MQANATSESAAAPRNRRTAPQPLGVLDIPDALLTIATVSAAKRHARATRSEIAGWWAQTVAQAERAGALPVLFFRLDRAAWPAVWSIAVNLTEQPPPVWAAYAWTAEGSVEAWAALARELASDQPERGASSRHAPSVSASKSSAAMYPTPKEHP